MILYDFEHERPGSLQDVAARLAELARVTGWQFLTHHTGDSAQAALLWLYGALEQRR